MNLIVSKHDLIVFDLDDTIYKEIDFLYSAFREIASVVRPSNTNASFEFMKHLYTERKDVFEGIIKAFAPKLTKNDLLKIYRNHWPDINLSPGVVDVLNALKIYDVPMSLLTNGRSLTQRNKIRSLGIDGYFQDIIISEEFGSEKPCKRNYQYFENKYTDKKKTYIGDNFSKDFSVPNMFGWNTIGLIDDGRNIHKQVFTLGCKSLPKVTIKSFADIRIQYV
jgi:putative hydrolase of the HAD superfamily